MDCELSRLLSHFKRSELTAEDAAALDAHRTSCPTCAANAAGDAALVATLQAAAARVPVPVELKGKLLAKEAEHRLARWRRNGTTAGAAALLLIAGIVGAFVVDYLRKPILDTNEIAVEFDRSRDGGDVRFAAWLKENGLPETIPWAIETRRITLLGHGTIQGRSVPVAHLQSGADFAQLFIVPEARFKIDPAKLKPVTVSNGSVAIERRGGFAFVIVYTSTDILPFLRQVPVN